MPAGRQMSSYSLFKVGLMSSYNSYANIKQQIQYFLKRKKHFFSLSNLVFDHFFPMFGKISLSNVR